MVKIYRNKDQIPKKLEHLGKYYVFYRTLSEDATTEYKNALGKKLIDEGKEWIIEPVILIKTPLLAVYIRKEERKTVRK